jgi:ABC-type amino acid transport substrate-binding protein
MHVDFTWQIVRGPAEVFTALESHTADVAIGAIAITSESEQRVDFSLPYFDSGLRIMVRARYEAGVVNTVKSIPWTAIGHLLTVGILVIFLLANVLWLIERRRKREPGRSYLSAIGEALWGAMLVVATLNVDRDSPAMKRVTILLMWLFGVVLIAQLTATVTSTQTVARLQSTIRGPEDLPGKIIASVPGTVAGDLSDCARPAVHDRHLWTGRDSHAHARRGPGGGIRRRDAAVLGGQGGQGRRAGRRAHFPAPEIRYRGGRGKRAAKADQSGAAGNVRGWDLRENLLGVVRRRAVKLLRDPLGDHKVSTRATRMTSHEPGPVSLRVIDVLMYTPSSRIAFTRYPVKRTV